MRPVFALIPLIVLAACASDRDICIRQAQSELRGVELQISTAQGNIDRGFAIHTSREYVEVDYPCPYTNDAGETIRRTCETRESVERETPVAIDVRAEQEKVNRLEARLAGLRRTANQGVAACAAQYPEG